ncbi:MAG: UDP-N-acetylmuramate dehydrogenase [Ruminococcaceae bacterium]|nr:UDP-N-acetylmuramate dehydrogenase [Oscillospiraceae bacterium]
MEAVFRAVEAVCPAERRANMQKYTSFKIGGCADLLAQPQTKEQLLAVLRLCREIPHAVIGNGTNLLVGDGGYRGVLIRIGNAFSGIRVDGSRIYAQAGATLGAVARAALEAGLSGMEPLSGIPGTVGGAVLMNAGAYGGEMADVIEETACIRPDLTSDTVLEHGFSYRHSTYQENGCIVTDAVFSLTEGDREEIRSAMDTLSVKRREKQPLTLPSAGSAFKRPAEGYAAQMIDEAGLRGFSVGDAAVSEKHAGFVVNLGGATARDVRTLLCLVQEKVQKTHGVLLEPEIRFLGDFT